MDIQTIKFSVEKTSEQKATVRFVSSQTDSACQNCSQKSHCTQLSIALLFKYKKPITIANQDFTVGETLEAELPKKTILNSLLLLILLPLIGFICTVIVLSNVNEIMAFTIALFSMYGCVRLGQFILDQRLKSKLTIKSRSSS